MDNNPPNRRHAIIWPNADPFHWRIYAAPGGDELKVCFSNNNRFYNICNISLLYQIHYWNKYGVLQYASLEKNYGTKLIAKLYNGVLTKLAKSLYSYGDA